MRILIACADRDFLEAYGRLLSEEFEYVRTAFDGTAVLGLTAEEDFDVCVIDAKLPRVNWRTVVSRLDMKKIPSAVLLYRKLTSGILCGKDPVTEYVPLPFSPEELTGIIRKAAGSYGVRESFEYGGISVEIYNNRIGGWPVTLAERNLMRFAADNDGTGGDGADISYAMSCTESLNRKLEKTGYPLRIKFVNGKGFKLVRSDE